MVQSLVWDHALKWWGTFKEKNLEAIPAITWARFKAKLNARFMPHNQVLRHGLELLALRQGEGMGSLAKHIQILMPCYVWSLWRKNTPKGWLSLMACSLGLASESSKGMRYRKHAKSCWRRQSAWKMIMPTPKAISHQHGTTRKRIPKARQDSMEKRKESGKRLPTTRGNSSFKKRNRELKLIAQNVIPMEWLVTLLRCVLSPIM